MVESGPTSTSATTSFRWLRSTGNPNGAEALSGAGKGGLALRAAVVANADQFAKDLVQVVSDIR